MKNKIVIGILIGLSYSTEIKAQKMAQSDVPSVVVNAFEKAHGTPSDIDWKREGDYFVVDFEANKHKDDIKIWYHSDGTVFRTKKEIPRTALPVEIVRAIQKNYKGYRIDDCAKITEGKYTKYSVEIENSTEEWKILLDETGQIISKKSN